MVRKENKIVRHEMRGGKGDVYMYHILPQEEMMGHGRLFARIVLPAGSSIGRHTHEGDTEPYYILRGNGIFTDADGSRVPVGPGDICTIACGESHAIENTGEEDLEMIALVLFEA